MRLLLLRLSLIAYRLSIDAPSQMSHIGRHLVNRNPGIVDLAEFVEEFSSDTPVHHVYTERKFNRDKRSRVVIDHLVELDTIHVVFPNLEFLVAQNRILNGLDRCLQIIELLFEHLGGLCGVENDASGIVGHKHPVFAGQAGVGVQANLLATLGSVAPFAVVDMTVHVDVGTEVVHVESLGIWLRSRACNGHNIHTNYWIAS